MSYIRLLPILVCFNTLVAQSPNSIKHIGQPFTLTGLTAINDLTDHPERYFNTIVKVEGIIASACTNEGCFIEVVPPDGSGEGIVANFPEFVHAFPTDCAGRRAIVEGMFYQKIYPAARVLHWQEHSFRKGEHIPEFSLVKRITASAVDIGQRVSIPPSDSIQEASVDRIDLNRMEFEAEGFGTGKKILNPGEVTDEHSTGKSREIIYCMEGTLTVKKGNKPPITLQAGEMCYIPPDTRHAIKNESDKRTVYIFTFSQKPDTKKDNDHR